MPDFAWSCTETAQRGRQAEEQFVRKTEEGIIFVTYIYIYIYTCIYIYMRMQQLYIMYNPSHAWLTGKEIGQKAAGQACTSSVRIAQRDMGYLFCFAKDCPCLNIALSPEESPLGICGMLLGSRLLCFRKKTFKQTQRLPP